MSRRASYDIDPASGRPVLATRGAPSGIPLIGGAPPGALPIQASPPPQVPLELVAQFLLAQGLKPELAIDWDAVGNVIFVAKLGPLVIPVPFSPSTVAEKVGPRLIKAMDVANAILAAMPADDGSMEPVPADGKLPDEAIAPNSNAEGS